MAISIGRGTPTGSAIVGLGVCRPRRAVSNGEVCARIDSTEEWIETRSGIVSRFHADDEETLCRLGSDAGRKALAAAGVQAARLSCVIVASMSNTVQTPPLAISVAHALGATEAGGFDVSAACAGFCHALGLAGNMVSAGEAEYVLVVGAERMTDIVSPVDRTIAFLFGDGAGAVVVGPSEEPGIGPTVRGADGTTLDALRMTNSWSAFRADPESAAPYMIMDGKRVFRWAVAQIVPAAKRAIAAAGLTPSDLAAFIPHQANLRMIEVLAARLGLPDSVVVAEDVVHSGNTSAASIPLAMDRLLACGAVSTGEPALLIAFGAGLNYAAQVVRLP
ncbi:beta-ketoacyl-ACP synthase 3 [Pseudonocardia spinosispora]|uniref:beta-ketoacyl-ACP synthase 3 n=1 Tax=Pseudonocardia spinosispora TaxID=103441 RepID=UPI00040EBE4A|nr:beta-ketoacyl-ACP synthase 3 [Pseudonocardia spinosispora]